MESNQPYNQINSNRPVKDKQSGAAAAMWGATYFGATSAVGEGALHYVRNSNHDRATKFDDRLGNFLKSQKEGMIAAEKRMASNPESIKGLDKLAYNMGVDTSWKAKGRRTAITAALGAGFGLLRNKSEGVI